MAQACAKALTLTSAALQFYYSSCDCDPVAQMALSHRKPNAKSAHVFRDVLDRLKYDDRRALKEIEAHYLE
eukprot:214747-Alexandrium_andersonii.AAC.1